MTAFFPVTTVDDPPGPRKGWRWCLLSDVARLESGHTPSRREPSYWDGGDVPWLSLKDIRGLAGRYVTETEDKPTPKGIDNSSARVLPQGTVAFCRTASVGKVAILGRDMATSQDFANWVCGPDLLPEYLYEALRASGGQFDKEKQGTTHKTIYMPVLERFRVLVPPLPEQRRIADILDKADAIRRKRKEAIALTEELLRSAFLEIFGDPLTNPKGWPTAAIEDVASSDRNALAIGPFGSNLLASDYTERGHPVVFVRDLVTERFVWKSDVFVSARKFEELAAHHAEPGDVLATKMGTPPGIACVVPQGFPRAVVTADVVKISVDRTKVFPDYLAAAINSSWGRHQIAGITAGVTRAKITLRDFRKVQVRLPDLEQQGRYVNYATKVRGSAEGQTAAMRHAEDLFNSLVARAFSGALESSR